MSTRLVLILGGGVSLGTYIAGALAEIYWGLRHANGDLARPESRRDVRVEALAGASAGALCAGAFARALVADPAAIADLRRAWVDEISLEELLRRGSGFDPLSILSSAKIEELAQRLLSAPPDPREWQPFCAEPLRVAFTLTNLGGVRYRIEYANRADGGAAGKAFFSTRVHADHARFQLESTTPPSQLPELWARLRAAALASGAFPGAFAPRRIDRPVEAYTPAAFGVPTGSTVPMWYADGGVLENEPIGLAKALVEENPEHARLDYRYLLVDPYLDAPPTGQNEPYAEPASLFATLGAVASAALGQANAKDWLRANKVNWRLAAHERFVATQLRPMLDALLAGPAGPASRLGETLAAQARAVARFKVGVNRDTAPTDPDVQTYLASNLARIAADPRYAAALAGLAGAGRTAMLAAIFLLESAAGLRDKEPMALYLIAPRGREEHPLAGDFLHNFAGFFRREWREHDYLCGRRDARAVLTSELRVTTGDAAAAPLFDYPPEPGVEYSPEPVRVGPEQITPEERARLRRYLTERLQPLMRERLPWWLRLVRGPIAGKAADAAMKQMGF